MPDNEPAHEKEHCPFDPHQIRAENCKWGRTCPWFVYEGNDQCYCAVGVTPEQHMQHMLAARHREATS